MPNRRLTREYHKVRISVMKTIMSVVVSLAITLAFAQAQNLNLLPGDATLAPAAGDQTAPAIARGGNILLAVWADNRANPYRRLHMVRVRNVAGHLRRAPRHSPATSSTPSRSRSSARRRTRIIRRLPGTAPTGWSSIRALTWAGPATTRIRSKPCACRRPARCSTPNRSNSTG